MNLCLCISVDRLFLCFNCPKYFSLSFSILTVLLKYVYNHFKVHNTLLFNFEPFRQLCFAYVRLFRACKVIDTLISLKDTHQVNKIKWMFRSFGQSQKMLRRVVYLHKKKTFCKHTMVKWLLIFSLHNLDWVQCTLRHTGCPMRLVRLVKVRGEIGGGRWGRAPHPAFRTLA